MVQLRLLTDIVGFDLTHVYLALDVLESRGDTFQRRSNNSQRQSLLKLTMPECHVFLRALREFNGLIEVMTPLLLEEGKQGRPRQNGLHGHNGDGDADVGQHHSLDQIIERLNIRASERLPKQDEPD